jgi:hypothetical protein
MLFTVSINIRKNNLIITVFNNLCLMKNKKASSFGAAQDRGLTRENDGDDESG